MGKVEIEVQPGSRRSGVVGYDEWRGRFRVAVRAPPEKGKANEEVVEVIAAALGVPPSAVSVVRGHTSRRKTVEVRDLTDGEIVRRLRDVLGAGEGD
jgi:hypothetical protein